MAILTRALQRDPAQRFPSAAAMGEACEHFLYDKGYGPTNLTLKQYLGAVFGERRVRDEVEPRDREPTLIPMGDEMPRRTFDDGRSSPRRLAGSSASPLRGRDAQAGIGPHSPERPRSSRRGASRSDVHSEPSLSRCLDVLPSAALTRR